MKTLDNVSELLDQPCEWIRGEGEESDIVISSRARLARNIQGFPFSHKASDSETEELEATLKEKCSRISPLDDSYYISIPELSEESSQFLVERHLISQEHAEGSGQRSVIFDRNERIAIMLNEEDHLRMQVMRSGFNLSDAWDTLDEMDTKLEDEVVYAFSPKYGYLTSCPTNTGTALRISVMLHLPILNMADEMKNVFNSLSQINFTARGLYGEGTEASGDFFQISNQVTMNHSETEFIDQLSEMVPEIVQFENKWRERMYEDDPILLEDRIWRGYGTLQNARKISSEEALQCLSAVRLGASTGFIDDISMEDINELVLHSLPAHLQKKKGKSLDSDERDHYRAEFIRSKLS